MNSEHLHPSGRPFTKDEFVEKIKTDKKFADRFGNLGPIYGAQWRKWKNTSFPKICKELSDMMGGRTHIELDFPIDQIQNSIDLLKTDPDSRRNRVSAWNVGELDQMVLPPCHTDFQFYTRELSIDERLYLASKTYDVFDPFDFGIPAKVDHDEIDKLYPIPKRAISLMWNQRSVDTFLGLPFNIASYGLLLEIIAKEVNMVPDELIGNLGDVHLYSNHIEQAKEQIGREPYKLPVVNINSEFWNPGTEDGCGVGPGTYTSDVGALINSFEITDFQVEHYKSHPTIKAPLSN